MTMTEFKRVLIVPALTIVFWVGMFGMARLDRLIKHHIRAMHLLH